MGNIEEGCTAIVAIPNNPSSGQVVKVIRFIGKCYHNGNEVDNGENSFWEVDKPIKVYKNQDINQPCGIIYACIERYLQRIDDNEDEFKKMEENGIYEKA